jgi:high-affinity iron transporter
MLREGLEAALIVSLIASYLKRTQRGNWIGVMWIGVFLAAALCLGLGTLKCEPQSTDAKIGKYF